MTDHNCLARLIGKHFSVAMVQLLAMAELCTNGHQGIAFFTRKIYFNYHYATKSLIIIVAAYVATYLNFESQFTKH